MKKILFSLFVFCFLFIFTNHANGLMPPDELNVSSCTIPVGGSECPTSITWYISGTGNYTLIDNDNGGTIRKHIITTDKTSPKYYRSITDTLGYQGRTFTLFNSLDLNTPLATANAKGSCSTGYSWNGSICSNSIIDNPPTGDATPRIMYWDGKVNQHIDANGFWQTDEDGVSGSDLNKLIYCKKFFPNTISVRDYKNEFIKNWKQRNNLNSFSATKMSTQCVQSVNTTNTATATSITVVSPNGGQIYKDGQQITVNWDSKNISKDAKINISLAGYNASGQMLMYTPIATMTSNDGIETANLPKIPTYISSIGFGNNFKVEITDNGNGNADQSDNYFTINSDLKKEVLLNCIEGYVQKGESCVKEGNKEIPTLTCPVYEMPREGWCNNGTIVNNIKDENGCMRKPICNQNNRTIRYGSRGEDVLNLQRYLNSNGYIISSRGIGSKGMETDFFGIGTRNALKRFQTANKIRSTGILDANTKSLMK